MAKKLTDEERKIAQEKRKEYLREYMSKRRKENPEKEVEYRKNMWKRKLGYIKSPNKRNTRSKRKLGVPMQEQNNEGKEETE